jgi:hypothetical protein
MKTLLTVAFMILSLKAFSHPVIYQGGWALNSSNMSMYSNNYALYSLTNRISVGVEHDRFDEEELGLLKMNSLLWRQNGDDSQANLYFHGGAGFIDQNEKGSRGIFNLGIEGDWETRTLYTSWKHLQFPGAKDANYSITQGRVGLSPVKTPYEQLQIWFMLQGMVIHDVEDTLMITPMLRFFYHNVLWEVGSSTRGDWMLNLMVHY